MAQLVRAPPCHGGGRRFEPDLGRLNGVLAQLGEHLPYKQRVIGSSPIGPIFFLKCNDGMVCRCGSILDNSQELTIVGRAADYKSAVTDECRCGSIGRAADL